jgi:hypothetical protein
VALFSAQGFGADYRYTLIAETGSEFAFLSSPALNNRGEVVVRAGLGSGGEALIISKGNKRTTLVSAPFSLSNPAINDFGSVSYDSAAGVFLVSKRSTATLANSFDYAAPSVNNSSDVAFWKVDSSAILIGSQSDSATILYDTSGPFAAMTAATLNDFGSIAFIAGLDAGGQQVLLGDGRVPIIIADTDSDFLGFGGTVPDVNNNGIVAFFAFFGAGEQGIFLGDGTGTSPVVDSLGPFAEFRSPNVNSTGTVAFEAILDGQSGRGVYIGPDTLVDRVIGPGDILFDSSVITVFLSGDQALNDSNEVVFVANLSDGRQVVALAKPRKGKPRK